MTEESLGTAALYLKVNTDGMDAGVAKAKRSQEDLAQAAARASQQFEQNSRRQIAALERSIAVFGKDQEAKLRWRIEQQTSGKVAEELTRKLDQQVASTRAAAEAQKQLAAAQERSNAIQAEATLRLQQEAAQRERNWAKVRAQFADEQRLATMRANAAAAFGPQLAAQERLQAGLDREAGVRQRLATFLNTERGQRIASASAIGKEASAAAASGAAALGATKAFSGSAKTARELQFAMRGLPAQLTDIGVSLASGQKPMLVLLQQGGQLKDMFGGIRPAAQALGGAFLRMVNPATLAAAAVATLAIAWNQAEKDASAFTNALLTSGNYADRTVQQLDGLVDKLSDLQGVTVGGARDAILQVAQSGRFAGEQFEMVATAAARMKAATGQSIDATTKKFEDIAKAPVETLLKLNETEHFLTEAQYGRVRALEEEGRKQDAAAEAMRIYNDRLNDVADAAEAARPHLAGLWQDVTDATSKAWRETKNFAEFLAAAGEQFSQKPWWQKVGPLAGFTAVDALTGAEPVVGASPKPVAGAANSDQLRAAQEFDRAGLRFATDRVKMERDIAEARKLGVQAGKSELEIEKRISEIRADYARKGKKPASLDNANARAALQAFQDQLKVEQGAIANATQLLQAQYSARLVTVQKYYEDQRALAQRGTAAEEQALQGQIGVLKARNVTDKDAADVARQLATLEAELAKVRADGATKLAILNIQEADALKQRRLAAQAYQSALDESNAALQDQINTMVARIGMGEREFEIQSKVNEVYRDQAKELLNLARQRDAGDIDQETYEARTAALKDFTEKQVQIVRDGYDRMAEAQGNWSNGAIKALKDYADQAADVAGQTYGLFTDAFKGAEDVLTDFITKGKADWKGYLDSLAAEITRFAVRQQLAKLAKKFLPGMTDGQESQAGALSSAAGQLAASATPLYGAAAALSSAAAALAAAGTANGVSGSGSSGGGWLSAIAGLFGNSGSGSSSGTADYSYLLSAVFGSYAKGAAFNRGAVTAFAGGGVVGSPTYFPMANRRLGLMGEAGPEAIVPLHKGPDGKLGIRMERDMPQRSGPSVLNQTVIVQGLMDSRTPNQLAQASRREQNRAASRNS